MNERSPTAGLARTLRVSPEIAAEMDRVYGPREAPPSWTKADPIKPLPDDVKIGLGDGVVLPSHYKRFKIEPAFFSRTNNLSGLEFNIIKYVLRAPYKHADMRVDYSKAIRSIVMECKYRLGDPEWHMEYKTPIAENLKEELSYERP